ncbi:uncharacterized protein LOC129635355 isoform X2 [Bubalus kerabau]|uniref:uncharacterized protein LOC129635355 isoform X2 n=1 Tax=Bubalus carabanensis TaxID=3119969 RepID=UPI00244E681E|nr:uncharacterized protein LOC129635355 isoform X2 [Bubalus carabanensis]
MSAIATNTRSTSGIPAGTAPACVAHASFLKPDQMKPVQASASQRAGALSALPPKIPHFVPYNMQYFGHLMRRVDSLEKTLMLGGIGGKRRRRRQRMRWLDGITDSMDCLLEKAFLFYPGQPQWVHLYMLWDSDRRAAFRETTRQLQKRSLKFELDPSHSFAVSQILRLKSLNDKNKVGFVHLLVPFVAEKDFLGLLWDDEECVSHPRTEMIPSGVAYSKELKWISKSVEANIVQPNPVQPQTCSSTSQRKATHGFFSSCIPSSKSRTSGS